MSAPKPMLCHDGKDHSFPSGMGWMMEPKLDGWRWIMCVEEYGIKSYSGRNGSDRTGQARGIELALNYLPPGTVLDGELVVIGEQSPKVATVLAHPEQGALHYVVFDVLRVAGHSTTHLPWHERRELLDTLAGTFDGIDVTMSTAVVASEEQHQRWLADGYEGSVSKRVDSTYYPGKRSRDWLKFKPQQTADGVVVDLEEGEGGWAGTYGAFRLRLAESGAETTCAIPTRGMRKQVTDNPEAFVGRMIEIRHHGVIGSSGLVRHPVFSRMRPDLDREEVAA